MSKLTAEKNFYSSPDFIHRDRHDVEINAASPFEAGQHCAQIMLNEFKSLRADVIQQSTYPMLEQEWCNFLEEKSTTGENRFDVIVRGEHQICEITHSLAA
jgi:hypothetical protein